MHTQKKAQKRPEKALSLHLKLRHRLQQSKNQKWYKKQEGGESDFQSNHIIKIQMSSV